MTHAYSLTPENAQKLAQDIIKHFKPKDCICLTGDLGAGKTTFAYFIAKAWLKQEPSGFASPTFTLMNQYVNKTQSVNHVDLYRLNSPEEFWDLDLISEWQNEGSLTLVEWGQKFDGALNDLYQHHLNFVVDDKNEDQRILTWTKL